MALLSLLAPAVARAGVRIPFTCHGAVEVAGDRDAYFAALRAEALLLLADNRLEVDEALVAFQSADVDDLSAEAILRETELKLMAVIDLRARLEALVRRRDDADRGALNIQTEIGRALRDEADGDATYDHEAHILRFLANLGGFGIRVVHGGRDYFSGEAVPPTAAILDLDLDIRAALTAVRTDAESDCVQHGRLAHVGIQILAESERIRALKSAVDAAAPILDVELPCSGLFCRRRTLGQHLEAGASGAEFRGLLREALEQTKTHLVEVTERIVCAAPDQHDQPQCRRVEPVTLKELAASQIVKSAVFIADGVRFEDIACIVDKTITGEDLAYGILYTAGGLAAIGASVLGQPAVVPLILAAVQVYSLGVGIADTIRRYQDYREAYALHTTGLMRMGLLAREQVARARMAYIATLATTLVDGAVAAIQVIRLMRALPATAAAVVKEGANGGYFKLGDRPWDRAVSEVSSAERHRLMQKYEPVVRHIVETRGDWPIPRDWSRGQIDEAVREFMIASGAETAAVMDLRTGEVSLRLGSTAQIRFDDTVEMILVHGHPNGGRTLSAEIRSVGGGFEVVGGDLYQMWKTNEPRAFIATADGIVAFEIPYGQEIFIYTHEWGSITVQAPTRSW